MKTEIIKSYRIDPVVLSKDDLARKPVPMKSGIDLVVVGSLETAPGENKLAFGEHIAGLVAQAASTAAARGKRLVLDAATGSSPKTAWDALSGMVSEKQVDLSNVIIIGHEEAWGPKPGSSTDFDFQRRKMLESFGINVKPLSAYEVFQAKMAGNFVPMYRVGVSGTPSRGERVSGPSEEEAARLSAEEYTVIVRELLQRGDVESIGVYGIGTDGHIGEWQISDMGIDAAREHFDAFVQLQPHYSIEAGQYPTGGNPNIYWQRGANEGEALGRAAWQPEYSDQHVVVGLGLREMLALDHLVLAFNNDSKTSAFEHAMEGAVDGVLRKDGKDVMVLQRDNGEGEEIWNDLARYGRELEQQGLLAQETVDAIDRSKVSLKCGLLYKEIYRALEEKNAKIGDSIYETYTRMGEFTNRYVGKRSPLSQLIRMRALLGKTTTIVATSEVVRDSRYEGLTKN